MPNDLVVEAASSFSDALVKDVHYISPQRNQNHLTGIVYFETEPPVFIKLCQRPEESYRKQHMIERAVLDKIDHTPFPTPSLLSKDTIGENTLYYVSSVLPGKNLSEVYATLPIEEKERILWKIGKHIAQLQTHISFDEYGMFRFFPRMSVEEPKTPEDFYTQKLSFRLEQIDTKYKKYINPIKETFEKHIEKLDTLGPATITNRDLRPGNVLYDEEKGVTGIIDWESVFAGHSLNTLIKTRLFFIDFPIASEADRERLTNALYDGYQSEYEFPEEFEEHIEPVFELFSLSWLLKHDETFPDVPSVTTFPEEEQEVVYNRLFSEFLED